MSEKMVDPSVLELAEYFLDGVATLKPQEDSAMSLATDIQNAIEAWFSVHLEEETEL